MHNIKVSNVYKSIAHLMTMDTLRNTEVISENILRK